MVVSKWGLSGEIRKMNSNEKHLQGEKAEQALTLAMQHHTEGRLAEAEGLYQQILQANPNQPVVLHLLGVVAHQVGKNDVSVDLISQATALKPEFAEAHYNLGTARNWGVWMRPGGPTRRLSPSHPITPKPITTSAIA